MLASQSHRHSQDKHLWNLQISSDAPTHCGRLPVDRCAAHDKAALRPAPRRPCLQGNSELLEHPLTEEQLFRYYFLGKVHVHAALAALDAQDATMRE